MRPPTGVVGTESLPSSLLGRRAEEHPEGMWYPWWRPQKVTQNP